MCFKKLNLRVKQGASVAESPRYDRVGSSLLATNSAMLSTLAEMIQNAVPAKASSKWPFGLWSFDRRVLSPPIPTESFVRGKGVSHFQLRSRLKTRRHEHHSGDG